jgi:activator of HSP90 ATPase
MNVRTTEIPESTMNHNNEPVPPADAVSRRQAIAEIAITLCGLAAGSRALGQTPGPSAKEAPGAAPNQARTSLHYEADFGATARRIYEALLDSKQFAAFTGMPAEIDRREGGAFSMFGGLIVGRNVELIPDRRIVQAWRPAHWPAGIYSIVKFEFQEQGAQARLVLDHTGFPQEESVSLDHGWKSHYLVPLSKFLA